MKNLTIPTRHLVGRWILWISGTILILCLAGFVYISLRIGAAVRATAKTAVQHYPGNEVNALIQYVQDTNHSLQDRNRAVWALGQLGDQKALSSLRQFYTGQPCDHQKDLCQRELGKAIKLLDGGVNVTAVVWRR